MKGGWEVNKEGDYLVIAPQTIIHLIEGCPLDDDYEHTIYWGPTQQADQIAYFTHNIGNGDTRVFHDFVNYTYQRVEKGKVRVEISGSNRTADALMSCNYISFKNDSYNGKWFFGFVESVEYINNKVAEITFKIDALQTWHFDYALQKCMVERQHVDNDTPGFNTIPENLEYGDYYFTDQGMINLGNVYADESTPEYYIVVAATCTFEGDSYEDIVKENIVDWYGGLYDGVYSACAYNVFMWPKTVNEFLDAVYQANKADSIVAVFMVPSGFFVVGTKPIDYNRKTGGFSPSEYQGGDEGVYGTGGISGGTIRKSPQIISREFDRPTSFPYPNTQSTYTPRNRKLLISPYCKMVVTNNNTEKAEYNYEYFHGLWNTKVMLSCACALSAEPEAGLWPRKYKGMENNYPEKLVIKDFPLCCYSIDSFKAWIAQRRSQITVGYGIDAVNAGLGIFQAKSADSPASKMGGVAAGIGSVDRAAMRTAQIIDNSTLPPHAMGTQTNTFNMALEIQGFHVYLAQIRAWYAEKLDGFFDRFGYRQDKFLMPERNVRPHYTYLKTTNCEILGSMPMEYYKEIISIYNRGVTWWNNPVECGHYTDAIIAANVAPIR